MQTERQHNRNVFKAMCSSGHTPFLARTSAQKEMAKESIRKHISGI